MNRREAIKNMSLSFGSVLASGTMLSILNSCSNEKTNWKPEFLNKEQIHVIDNLVDLILPKTNTPGGIELNLTQFIDKVIAQTLSKKRQNIFNLGSQSFSKVYKSTFKREAIEGSREDFKKLLDVYFNLPDTEQQTVFNLLSYKLADVPTHKKESYLVYKFLTRSRSTSLLGYYTSQEIMEGVQGYNSVPIDYNGCVDFENNI